MSFNHVNLKTILILIQTSKHFWIIAYMESITDANEIIFITTIKSITVQD